MGLFSDLEKYGIKSNIENEDIIQKKNPVQQEKKITPIVVEKKEEDLECGHGGIVRKGLRRYGCYRDEEGKLHRVDIRCTHMGCELLWNSEERTWDCPCHGSRFDYDGNLIDNPAKRSKGRE